MELSTKPLAGMRQLYPADMRVEEYIEGKVREAGRSYGFEEYDCPTLEPMELFLAKSGSELVLEQSYRLTDRGGRELLLRPELTPSLARMIAGAGELHLPIRWMAFPICFRYERPQRGRVREFKQFNCDILGVPDIAADVEVVLVLDRIMKSLGAAPGTYAVRYSNRRLASELLLALGVPAELHQTAFTVLDRKSKMSQEDWDAWAADRIGPHAGAVAEASGFTDLDDLRLGNLLKGSGALAETVEFKDSLSAAGVTSASFDAGVVRGLDYYTGMVFELLDTGGENRRAICGGGRYDNLVGLFGGRPMTGVGFGLGLLTLRLFLETYGLVPAGVASGTPSDVFVAVFSKAEREAAFAFAEGLRARGLRVEMDLDCRNLGRQFKAAARTGVPWVAVIGPEEAAAGRVALKDMGAGGQTTISMEEAGEFLERHRPS